MTGSPEEGLRLNGCHVVTRKAKNFTRSKLVLLKMGQDESKMVTDTADHAIKAGIEENWILFTAKSRSS